MQNKNMLRAFVLGSMVLGLGVAGCDKYDRDRDTNRTTAEERTRAAEETRPVTPAPSATAPVTPSAPTSPYAPAAPVSGVSDDTRKDQIDTSVDGLKVQQDKKYDELYGMYAQQTGDKRDKDVPVTFKSHCKSAGKGDSVMGTDKTKSFFAQADVKAKCAEIVDLDKRIDAMKERK